MNNTPHLFLSRKTGLALSGGGVRGLAHAGVIKALTEAGIQPVIKDVKEGRGLARYLLGLTYLLLPVSFRSASRVFP